MAKLALVTGGSRGIGAATCLLLAETGYDVCFSYLSNADAAHTVAKKIQQLGQRGIAIQADVSIEQDITHLFSTCDQELGCLTALVNNAGIVARKARVDEFSLARFEHMMRVNVTGTFLCCQAAIKRMSERHGGPGGSIVNLSSVAAKIGSPGEYVDYAAAKAAVDTFSVGLAKEVANENVRVNVVRPGIIDTEIHASGGQPDRVDRLKHLIPMGRGGFASEIAQAIVWLLSDKASYTTGTILDVSGGR